MEDNKTFTSRAGKVQANLDCTLNNIKEHKLQSAEVSLSIIAQCQIDISYTLALILDEMRKSRRQGGKMIRYWEENAESEV